MNLLRTLLAGFMLWRLAPRHSLAMGYRRIDRFLRRRDYCSGHGYAALRHAGAFGAPVRKRTGEGFIFALSYSTTGLYNDVDKAMLGHYGMNAANGIYSMAYRVVDVCTTPITSIQGAAFPRFFCKGVEGVRSTADYAVRILKRTAPLALISALAMVLAAPIIPHLVGRGFAGERSSTSMAVSAAAFPQLSLECRRCAYRGRAPEPSRRSASCCGGV